jgi:hypothetical protein
LSSEHDDHLRNDELLIIDTPPAKRARNSSQEKVIQDQLEHELELEERRGAVNCYYKAIKDATSPEVVYWQYKFHLRNMERRRGSVILLLIKKLQLTQLALWDTVTLEFRMMIASS